MLNKIQQDGTSAEKTAARTLNLNNLYTWSNDMAEEIIDIELKLGKKQADELLKLTKPELMNRLVVMILRNHVQDETVAKLENENSKLETMLDVAQSYVEQARNMIQSVMNRWYEYDV